MRVTIAGAMGLVALAAVGLAALRYPTPLVASCAFTLSVAALLAAVVAAISLPGRSRAIWSSFATCGTVYLALGLAPWSDWGTGPHLASTPLIDYGYHRATGYDRRIVAGVPGHVVSGPHQVTAFWTTPQHPTTVSLGMGSHTFLNDYSEAIRMVPTSLSRSVHSLLGLGVGAAGALFALLLTRSTHSEPLDHP